MRPALRLSLCAITLAFSVTAQNTIVSPAGTDALEGNGANAFPWGALTLRRYQQVHDDIAGTPKIISKLAFRLTAATTLFTETRDFEVELFMGHGHAYPNWSYTFAKNYKTGPVTAIAKKVVAMGPQGQSVTPGPNPFTANMDLVLDAPFPYNGVDSLVWEVAIHSITFRGTSWAGSNDVDSSTITSGITATTTGTGCNCTGRTAAMTHTVSHADMGGTYVSNYSVANGPSNAAVLQTIGATNPNLPVAGLCSNLLTDALILRIIGFTDAVGAITTNTPMAGPLVAINTFGGAVLFSQCHALDLTRPDPIGICNSNGLQVTVPMPNTTRTDKVMRLLNSVGNTTATEGVFFNTSTIGYGLVTEFTYN
jgi:hypothetical protein